MNRNWRDLDNDALDEIALRQDGKNANSGRPPHEPLTSCDLSAWARREPPEREWAVLERFSMRFGPPDVLAIEVFDRAWKPVINTSRVVVEVGQLRARALVS